jgi:glycine/D-amino acid oxidase-like deaminating enzyme
MRVVICGGGVIGACIAYFLARRGIDVIVIERTGGRLELDHGSRRSIPLTGRNTSLYVRSRDGRSDSFVIGANIPWPAVSSALRT